MVFNPLLRSDVVDKKELTVMCAKLSSRNKICSFDRATYGYYLVLERADLCCKYTN